MVEDLPSCETCAQQFYASSRFLVDFKIERFCQVWKALFESGAGVVFILVDGDATIGTIGGVIHADLYSGRQVATEFFWFVQDGHRGAGLKLYRMFEAWAREQGATEIRMVHLMDSMPEKLSRVYHHLGFVPIETHYAKGLVA